MAEISIDGIFSAVEGKADEVASAVTAPIKSALGAIAGSVRNSTSSTFGNVLANSAQGIPPWPNTLENFSSFNYIITLGCLTDDEVNNPDNTYRKNGPSQVILRSGGSGDKVLTEYETEGACEFFIDDLVIKSVLTPNKTTRMTNATHFSFQVLEPFSMGLFLQTLQIASETAGHKNYLQAPFMIVVEFKGYDDNGNAITVPNSKRFFPVKINNVQFNVAEGGSNYDCEGSPWDQQALTDNVQKVKTDISLTGNTVEQLLQSGAESLANVLNTSALKLEEAKQVKKANQYVFLFPKKLSTEEEAILGQAETGAGATSTSSGGERSLTNEQKVALYQSLTGSSDNKLPKDFDAKLSEFLGIVVRRSNIGESVRDYAENPENINEIGNSKIVKSYLDGGKVPFGEARFSEVEENGKGTGVFQRGKLTISQEGRKFTFAAGMRIQDIIEELIIISDYGRKLAQAEADENGMVPWFRIDTHVYNVTDEDTETATGQAPKIYVFRVVPYKVSESSFTSPTTPMPGWKSLAAQAAKEYNYIYTGQNKDILEFDIQIDNAFYLALNGFKGQMSKDNKLGGAQQQATGEKPTATKQNEGNNQSQAQNKPITQDVEKPETNGAGGKEHPENSVARSVNDAIVNGNADLVVINFKIMGDPYFIADSGMGNYTAKPDPSYMNINSTGSVSYENSEVDLIINFRTPIDYKGDGYMRFPGGGSAPVGAFSGLYRVVTVENNFSKGNFVQEIKATRRKNQEQEIKTQAVTTGNKIIDTETATKENLIDELMDNT